jgi:type VI protein secretion system component VasF
MPTDKIDLNDLINRPGHQLSIVPREDPETGAARREIEKAESAHRRQITLLLHIAALAVLGVVVALCVWMITHTGAESEDRKLAIPLLTSIATGLLGYVTGRASK